MIIKNYSFLCKMHSFISCCLTYSSSVPIEFLMGKWYYIVTSQQTIFFIFPPFIKEKTAAAGQPVFLFQNISVLLWVLMIFSVFLSFSNSHFWNCVLRLSEKNEEKARKTEFENYKLIFLKKVLTSGIKYITIANVELILWR